jgi:hypothetical protein
MPAPADSEGIWIWVRELPLLDDPVYLIANAGQEFRVEGRFTVGSPSGRRLTCPTGPTRPA